MRVNVDKVLDRDQKLSELDNRADALQAGASQFETSAAKLKRKYWWRNCKVRVSGSTCTGNCNKLIIGHGFKGFYTNECLYYTIVSDYECREQEEKLVPHPWPT